MLIVAVLVVVRDDSATWYVTVPLPDPGAPPVTGAQEALLVAVQDVPDGCVTVMRPVPPLAGKVAEIGLIPYVGSGSGMGAGAAV